MLLKYDGRATKTFPSELEVSSAIRALTPAGNEFLILERSPSEYMQAAVCDDGTYVVEYRAGSSAAHYEGAKRIDGQLLTEIMLAYLNGTDGWQTKVTWAKLDLQR